MPDVQNEDGRVPRRRGLHARRQSRGSGHRGGGARRGRSHARAGAGGAASTHKAAQCPRALGRRVVERAAGEEAGVAAQQEAVTVYVLIYVASSFSLLLFSLLVSYMLLAQALTTFVPAVLGTDVASGPCDQRMTSFYYILSDQRCKIPGEHRCAICELRTLVT